MSAAERSHDHLNQSGQNLVRVVIASYFLAVALGLIPGTTAVSLTAAFLPEPHAEAVGKLVIFAAGYLVLVGVWLRASALFLATVLFWSSYIANAGTGDLEAFWRDLALIGALILTYTQTLPRAATRRSALRWSPSARRVVPAHPVVPRRVVTIVRPARTLERPVPVAAKRPQPVRLVAVRPAEAQVSDNIFRDDEGMALVG